MTISPSSPTLACSRFLIGAARITGRLQANGVTVVEVSAGENRRIAAAKTPRRQRPVCAEFSVPLARDQSWARCYYGLSMSQETTRTTAIAILGMPKTGTSALYSAVKKQGQWLSIFEIGNVRQLDFLMSHEAPRKLAKILLPVMAERDLDLGCFDKRVMIVRDPRDVVISWLLYRPFLHGNYLNQAFMDDFLKLLSHKEKDPQSVSIRQLHQVYEHHQIGYTRPAQFRELFNIEQRELGGPAPVFLMRYEDFVDGQVGALSRHLGLALTAKTELGAHVTFNQRSKSYGAWRHWFTPEDVEDYREVFTPYLRRHGYSSNWVLAKDPVVPSATSSEHVLKHATKLRDQPESTGRLLPEEKYTDHRFAVLESAVADGRETAMIELALVSAVGLRRPRDLRHSLALLDDAVARGNPLAMIHRGHAHRHGVGGSEDLEAAKRCFSEAGRIRGNRRAKLMVRDYGHVWQAAKMAAPQNATDRSPS